jgi:hypothetical protein
MNARLMQTCTTPWHDMANWLQCCHGEKIGLWLTKRAGKDLRKLDLDCVDNFRTREGKQATQSYEEKRKDGCCGSFDKRYEFKRRILPSRFFWVGLNYGH